MLVAVAAACGVAAVLGAIGVALVIRRRRNQRHASSPPSSGAVVAQVEMPAVQTTMAAVPATSVEITDEPMADGSLPHVSELYATISAPRPA